MANSSGENRSQELGFSVVEAMISVAIIVAISLAALGVVKAVATVANNGYTTARGGAGVDALAQQLRSDATTALAVFVPSLDVHGNKATDCSQTQPTDCLAHEVDFYSKTDAGQDIFWAYAFDAANHSLQRFDYDANGVVGVRDPQTGNVTKAATYPPIENVDQFDARDLQANELVTNMNPYAPALTAALPGNTPQPLPVSFDNSLPKPKPELYGGNTIVHVALQGSGPPHMLDLRAGDAPSGFTYKGIPEYHVVIYRRDTVHRSWAGLAQVTKFSIYGHVTFSYDHFKNVAGDVCAEDPAVMTNMRINDRNAPQFRDYNARDYAESVYAIVNNCIKINKKDNNGQLVLPTPVASGATLPPVTQDVTPAPDTTASTPPQCLNPSTVNPSCFPPSEPPDWNPVPPPVGAPPPGFCDKHAASPVCAGGNRN